MAKNIKRRHEVTLQISGQTVFMTDEDNNEYVQFLPDETEGVLMDGWRHEGIAQRLRNGTFDFIARRRVRSSSVLLKKVAHGRLSATKDGAIQLTLKIFKKEGINFHDTFLEEAREAVSDI